ncbi:MAG: spore coat protein [Firmicutes bacterium]|nr:spore coat protein [Bacillota bacterium]
MSPMQAAAMSDRELLTDMLLSEKHLCMAYGMAELECTHPQLRAALHQLQQDQERFHQQLFQTVHQRGWYETPQADRNLAYQIASLWRQSAERPAGAMEPAYQSHPVRPAHQPQPAQGYGPFQPQMPEGYGQYAYGSSPRAGSGPGASYGPNSYESPFTG